MSDSPQQHTESREHINTHTQHKPVQLQAETKKENKLRHARCCSRGELDMTPSPHTHSMEKTGLEMPVHVQQYFLGHEECPQPQTRRLKGQRRQHLLPLPRCRPRSRIVKQQEPVTCVMPEVHSNRVFQYSPTQ